MNSTRRSQPVNRPATNSTRCCSPMSMVDVSAIQRLVHRIADCIGGADGWRGRRFSGMHSQAVRLVDRHEYADPELCSSKTARFLHSQQLRCFLGGLIQAPASSENLNTGNCVSAN